MSSALPFAASPAAEFPCDNPLLHEGVGWMCLSLGGPPRAIARARVPAVRAVWPGPAALPAPAEVAAEAPPSAEVDPDALFEAECGVEPALFVALPLILARAEALAALEAAALEAATLEAAALEAATLEAAALEAAALEAETAALEATAQEPAALEAEVVAQEPSAQEPEVVAQEPSAQEPEVVAQEPSAQEPEPALAGDGFVIHSVELLDEGAPAAVEVADPAAPDPWRELVGAVVAVAMAQGASRAAAVARGLLETDASPEGLGAELTAALGRAGILADSGGPAGAFLAAREAWRAVIRGLTDDFGAAAATTLDAWCETLLRALGVGAETKVDVRKALRREGVAAFGLRRVA